MRLIRYSETGWQPHFQSAMKQHYDYIVECNKDELDTKAKWKREGFTDWAIEQTFTYLQKTGLNINIDFCWTGIHIFFDPVEAENIRFFLNHLSNLPQRHEKEWLDDTPAYSLDMPYTEQISTLLELKNTGHIGAYVPLKGE